MLALRPISSYFIQNNQSLKWRRAINLSPAKQDGSLPMLARGRIIMKTPSSILSADVLMMSTLSFGGPFIRDDEVPRWQNPPSLSPRTENKQVWQVCFWGNTSKRAGPGAPVFRPFKQAIHICDVSLWSKYWCLWVTAVKTKKAHLLLCNQTGRGLVLLTSPSPGNSGMGGGGEEGEQGEW